MRKKVYLLCILWFIALVGYAQNVINEYTNFECSQSKLISVPFTDVPKLVNNKLTTVSNQIVFYEHRDQFSFWYKIVVTDDRLIECKISPINTNDSYVLYVYKYNKNDFCNKVYYGKMKPLKSTDFYKNKDDNTQAFELSNIKLKVKKNEAYYFCVLNTSPSNCGHLMQLIEGKDTLNIKAIHFPCSEDDIEPKPLPKKPPVKKAPIAIVPEQKIKLDTILVHMREESIKNKNVEAELKVKDELTGNELPIVKVDKNTYKIAVEKGKNYNVECSALGYKNFDHSIIVSEYINPDSNVFDVFLKPLKAGDNFVMNNIYFYPNTYALRKGSEKELSYLLNYLINNPEVKVELQGYTNGDNRCKKNKAYKKKGPEWNFSGSAKKLSQLRSEAIKKYLVQKGVDKHNIETKGFGGEKMIVENPKTLEAIEKNIRVEVLIVKDNGL
jgi:outer membrane protein OmpA-like peptidoglycan-associated protein